MKQSAEIIFHPATTTCNYFPTKRRSLDMETRSDYMNQNFSHLHRLDARVQFLRNGFTINPPVEAGEKSSSKLVHCKVIRASGKR